MVVDTEEYEAKSLIRKGYANLFAWVDYSFNPFQGCAHDCRYCDGKAEKYHLHSDFGTRVRIKKNAPELLERFLRRKGLPSKRSDAGRQLRIFDDPQASFVFFIASGVCDPYQPIEEKARITRQCLQIACDHGISVHILTKNKLALRDLDLLRRINRESYASVNYTITLADEDVQRIFEPGASTTDERIASVRELRKQGIPCGVYLVPTLPFIGDTDDNMNAIYARAKQAGAEFVQSWGLTLRPGRQKAEFFDTLRMHFPGLLPSYKQLYRNDNAHGKVDERQFQRLGLEWPEAKGFLFSRDHDIGYAPPRYIPDGRIQSNLRVSEVLLKAAFVSRLLGSFKDATSLTKAASTLERFHKDVFATSHEELDALKLPEACHEYISELSHDQKPLQLEKLEHMAYERIKGCRRADFRA
jgi:DNA repair photolyase